MIRALVPSLIVLGVLAVADDAAAKPPPFELAQKSVAQGRAEQKSVELDFVITRTRGALTEWKLSGEFAYGKPVRLTEDVTLGLSETPLRLLWIGMFAVDPIASVSKLHGFINSRKSTVGVHDGFVYVYGSTPRVAVYRDLKRLAWFEVRDDGVTWRVGLTWEDGAPVGVLVTRNGQTVLTARSKRPAPGAPKSESDE